MKLADPSGVLLIETALGHDYVMSQLDTGTLRVPTSAGEKSIAAHFGVASVQDGKTAWIFAEENRPSLGKP